MNMFDLDGVKSEKAHAMKRYNDWRSYPNILRAAEAIAAVALLGYWFLPAAMVSLGTAGDLIRCIVAVVDNHSVVFILINVLVISILFLSVEKSKTIESDLYDQYTSVAAIPLVYPEPVVRDDSRDKQIVPMKSRIESTSPAAYRRPEKTFTMEEEDRVVCCGEAVTAVKKSSYRSTQTERRRSSTMTKMKTTTTEVRRVEYRRSESSSAAAVTTVGTTEKVSAWGSRPVERMNSEEFRLTVEKFITEKKILMQENDVVAPRRGHNRHFHSGNSSSSCSALVPI